MIQDKDRNTETPSLEEIVAAMKTAGDPALSVRANKTLIQVPIRPLDEDDRLVRGELPEPGPFPVLYLRAREVMTKYGERTYKWFAEGVSFHL